MFSAICSVIGFGLFVWLVCGFFAVGSRFDDEAEEAFKKWQQSTKLEE